jgi:quercetin dioxygenase-like cupin family protein
MLSCSSKRRLPGALLSLVLGLLPLDSSADGIGRAPRPAHADPGLRTLLSTGSTITGEPIQYPSGNARVTAVEITLQPGQQTGWHQHPVPLFGYMLEGELTVDYGAKGKRIYRKGDSLLEAMNEAHNGRNTGKGPMRILAVFMGADGRPGTVTASPPKEQR